MNWVDPDKSPGNVQDRTARPQNDGAPALHNDQAAGLRDDGAAAPRNPRRLPGTARPRMSIRTVRHHTRRWLGMLAGRLLPRACLLCGQPCDAQALCAACTGTLPGQGQVRCWTCAFPLPDDWAQRSAAFGTLGHTLRPGSRGTCPDCAKRRTPLPLAMTIALANYAPPLDHALTALKFGQQMQLAQPLGMLLMDALQEALAAAEVCSAPCPGEMSGSTGDMTHTPPTPGATTLDTTVPDAAPFDTASDAATVSVASDTHASSPRHRHWPDALVPIPLSGPRLAERGYNQALQIALAMRAHAPLVCPPVRAEWLARARHTARQSEQSQPDRGRNLQGAFEVPDPARVAGRHIMLVDDVLTTGSTLAEATRALQAAGAAQVSAVVVARTV